jgi:hypothetical protein
VVTLQSDERLDVLSAAVEDETMANRIPLLEQIMFAPPIRKE